MPIFSVDYLVSLGLLEPERGAGAEGDPRAQPAAVRLRAQAQPALERQGAVARACSRRGAFSRAEMNFRMSGNTFGTLYCVTSFGESHGPAYGGVVDGCPPGLELSAEDIQKELDRRKPGSSRHVTQRRETDTVEILSGVYEGRTTGTRDRLPGAQRGPALEGLLGDRARSSAPATPTTPTGRSTASATRAAAAAPRRARPWCASPPARSRRNGCSERYGVQVRGLPGAARAAARFRSSPGRTSTPTRSSRRTRSWCRSWRSSWTSCARAATRAARASTWWPSGVPVGWGEPVYGRLDADIAGGDDVDQRGEGRGDRRRLRRRSSRRAASTATR